MGTRVWVALLAAVLAARMLGLFTVGLVTTGSMEPELPRGSVFFAVRGEAHVGDVVVYRAPDGAQVAHRVVSVDERGLTTKGDANELTDQEQGLPPVEPGRVAVVPTLGNALLAVRGPWVKPMGIAVAQAVLLTLGLRGVVLENRKKARGPLAKVRPHHLFVLAGLILLAGAPFLHDAVESQQGVVVQAAFVPTLVRVEGAEGVRHAVIAPMDEEPVAATGHVDIVRAPWLPGAKMLAAHGAVWAVLPAVALLWGLALMLRVGRW